MGQFSAGDSRAKREQPGVGLFWDPVCQSSQVWGSFGIPCIRTRILGAELGCGTSGKPGLAEQLEMSFSRGTGMNPMAYLVLQKAIATAPVVLVGGAGLINC